MKKLISILVALAMAAMLSVTAFAAEYANTGATDKDAAADEAYLVKYLKIDEGVTIPDDTFKFAFEPKASDTIALADYEGKVPSGIEIKARQMTPSDSTKDDGALVKAITIEDVFDGITFTKPGEYIYEVTETIQKEANAKGTYNNKTDANTQSYLLRVYVANETYTETVEVDGEPTEVTKTRTVINKVTVQDPETKKDIEVDDPSIETYTDVEPGQPTTKDLTQDEITATHVNGFTFVNDYDLNDEYKPAEDGAFKVSKATTGAYGDKTQAFPITVEVTFPNTYNGDKALDIYVGETSKGALENGKVTVELKDGETAYFKNLPEGAVVKVVEDLTTGTGAAITNAKYYIQTSESVTGGAAGVAGAVTDAAGAAYTKTKTNADADLTKLTAADVTYHDTAVAAEKDNHVDVTNNSVYEPSTTGILLSNLPYIVLALVAVGGMVAYVVVRRRNADEA